MNLLLMILAAVVVAVLLAYLIVKFIPLKMRWLISILLLAATAYLAYLIYGGIMEPINFNKDKKVRYAKVIENLKLIRDAEIKYHQAKGVYTKNKSALISFIENDSLAITQTNNVDKVIQIGGGLTKTISVRKVDTTGFEPAMKYFEGKNFEDMFKVPGTDKEFTIETGQVEKVAGLMVPVFQAKVDKESILTGMNKSLVKQELEAVESDQIKGAFVSVGSLEEVTTGGNWPPSYDKADAVAKKE
ncbi:hypothetical protein C7447_10234 [Tenacibaculum adriaticum]|uniref:Uncharacterized protein n=1 Tax=Tenacibaculum adriaticum TaxID=413713 RepID=A0A5S5DVQ6_9FLAO|nr:hypothetical protein [Tenacibaculum adriaticum]TYP98719.1 hypothetical protein C7447_10234 [Tenacibaculum adriaticum]